MYLEGRTKELKSQPRLRTGKYSYCAIRKYQYYYNKNHDKGPYTTLKKLIYIELASIMVYMLQYTHIHPNYITLVYIMSGLYAGILLSCPNKTLNAISLLIFFFRGVFDWADGHLARLKGFTSSLGAKLDYLGGTIGTISLYTGLGVYIFRNLDIPLYCTPYFLVLFYLGRRLRLWDSRSHTTDFVLLLVAIHLLFS